MPAAKRSTARRPRVVTKSDSKKTRFEPRGPNGEVPTQVASGAHVFKVHDGAIETSKADEIAALRSMGFEPVKGD